MSVFDILGYIGSFLVLVAYYFLSIEKQQYKIVRYQMLNIVGGCLLMFYTFHYHAYASMICNIIWVGIGINSIKYDLVKRIKIK